MYVLMEEENSNQAEPASQADRNYTRPNEFCYKSFIVF